MVTQASHKFRHVMERPLLARSGRSANGPFPLSARDQGSLEIRRQKFDGAPQDGSRECELCVFGYEPMPANQSLVEDVVSCVIDTPLCPGRRTRAGWADSAGGIDPLDETRASKYPRSRGFCRQQQPRNRARLWSGLARQNLAND